LVTSNSFSMPIQFSWTTQQSARHAATGW
jgi:hypothetical protein